MRRHPGLIAIVISLILNSCGANDHAKLKDQLTAEDVNLNQGQTVVFIPYQGCSTCLVKALDFFNKNHHRDNFQFIFINYRSQKEIDIRLRSTGITTDNYRFIKTPTDLYNSGISNFYPTILKNQSGEIILSIADPNHLDIWDTL